MNVLLVNAGPQAAGQVVTARQGRLEVRSTVDSFGYARLRGLAPGEAEVRFGNWRGRVTVPDGDASLDRLLAGSGGLDADDASYLRFWRWPPAIKIIAYLSDAAGAGRWMPTVAP